MNRTERLFAIAEYLRGRKTGVTAEQLAERFGVTIRTVYRDLASLQEAELPLRAERGRGGGYALDRAYTLPPVNLSPREAAVLITAGEWLSKMRIMPFADTLSSALDKVRAALNLSAQRELIAHMKTLELIGVPAKPSPPGVRRAVEQAWFESRPLRIRYRNKLGEPSQRTIRIEKIMMDRHETLLVCHDLDKGEPRQFRLHRIERAEVRRTDDQGTM